MKIRSNLQSESIYIRQQVAGVLVQYPGTEEAGRSGLSRFDIATILGITWDMVNQSIASLSKEGAIRIEGHRLIIDQEKLERIAAGTPGTITYALLTTRNGDSEKATAIIRRQPGVVMADQIEGPVDVIFAVEASTRESLAALLLRAIASVEAMTKKIELLPSKKDILHVNTASERLLKEDTAMSGVLS